MGEIADDYNYDDNDIKYTLPEQILMFVLTPINLVSAFIVLYLQFKRRRETL
jgi:hypothetical protein